MCRIQVFSAADLESECLVNRILALDRENMTQMLRESGREFPEQRRREVLHDPSLVLIALISEDQVVGYLDFCDDWRDPKDVYLSSIQVRSAYRRGMSVVKLLVAAAGVLKERPFGRLRGDVQERNTAALALFSRLGFEVQERGDRRGSLEVIGDRTLLDSRYATRLMRRAERHFRHG